MDEASASICDTRRSFLRHTSIAGAGLLLPAISLAQQKAEKETEKPKDDEGVSPAEDLMREHGLLNRVLLIYDHHVQLLAAKQTLMVRCWSAQRCDPSSTRS